MNVKLAASRVSISSLSLPGSPGWVQAALPAAKLRGRGWGMLMSRGWGMPVSPRRGLALSNSIVKPIQEQLTHLRGGDATGVGSSRSPPHSEAGCVSPVSLEKQLKIARGDVPQAAGSRCQVGFILRQRWDSGPGHAQRLGARARVRGGGHGARQPRAGHRSWAGAKGDALCSAPLHSQPPSSLGASPPPVGPLSPSPPQSTP